MNILEDLQKAIEQVEATSGKHCERYDYFTSDKELAKKLMKEIPGFKIKILPQYTIGNMGNEIYVMPTSDRPIYIKPITEIAIKEDMDISSLEWEK